MSLSVPQALRWAWRAFRANVWLYVAVILTLFAAWVALEVVVVAGQSLGKLFNLAAHLSFLVGFAGLCSGFIEICLQVAQGGHPNYRTLFSKLQLGPAMLAAQFIYLAGVTLGSVPLLIPGAVIAVRLVFFGPWIVTGRPHPLAALGASAALTRNRATALTGALLVLLLLNLCGALLLGLGLLVTVPVTMLTLTALYGQLVTTGQTLPPV